jgi:KaiC/GvpD/RAD55 family RecA-like ATPase
LGVVDFAIALTLRGYACYPVNVRLDERGKKRPEFPGAGWQQGEYPTDRDGIRAMWDGYDGIAINTEKSNMVLIDIDVKNVDGFAKLREAGVQLPPTPVRVRTPTGGEHWYYKAPAGIPVQTDNSGKLCAGVDVRAIGGIGFAPPTVVEGLGKYEFYDPNAMVHVEELPEFPRSVAEGLRREQPKVQTTDTRPALTFEQRARFQAKMDRILRDLSTMEDGQRNATMRLRMIRLFGIAMSLGEDLHAVAELARSAYFESGGSAEHELESFIEWAQKHAKFELPDDETDEAFEAEVASVIRRAKIQEEAKARLSPLKVTGLSDEDVLEFDPSAAGDEDWLIDGLLPRGETVILFGSPNSGKSFAAIDLALGMATGQGAWGKTIRPGRVMYLAGEGTRRLAVRRRAWEVFHQRTVAKESLQLRKMRLLLASDESVAEHRDLIKRHQSDLIIVDTMLRATEGLVLEVPGEASRAIAQLDRLREARPGATVMVLHHPPEGNQDKPSGSYPLRGNVDTILKLVNDAGVRTMSIAKSREGDTSWTGTFELRDIEIPGTRWRSAVFAASDRVAWQADDWG